MALPMVHLLAARRWAQGHPEYLECPEFYLGAISPDAIHVRDHDDKSHKNAVHLNNWISPHPDEVLAYWRTREAPFDIGYGVHVLTDGQWVPRYRRLVPQVLLPDGRVDTKRYYGDTLRTDNDYQVILAYDTRDWKQYEQPLTQENLHKSGPEKPLHKYFLYTGNTSWGIQNLAYDKASGNMHAAVYKGKKSHYPNYSYFVIDGSKAPERKQLQGFDPAVEAEVLSLLPEGLHDAQSDTWGWNFKWGTTGLCPIGDGYFYISHNAKDKQTGNQSSTVQLYKWTGNPDKAFEPVE